MSSKPHKLHPPNPGAPLLSQKMKTIQSIGTFNETPVNFSQFDQSIISKREVFVQNPFLVEGEAITEDTSEGPKVSRVQSDVGEITRMKMLFQSRVNNQRQAASRLHNKSMDRSPNGRSIQKHILKPTHTPSFNKFQPKNISLSIIQQPMPLKFPNQNVHVTGQQQNQKMRPNFSQSSSKKSAMDCSQISSKFEEYEFGYEFMNRSGESKVGSENQHLGMKDVNEQMNRDSTPKKIDFSQLKVVNPTLANGHYPNSSAHSQCFCQSTLTQFMQQTTTKLAELTQRLMLLEQQNYRLRQLQSKVSEQSQSLKSYQHQHQLLSQQNGELRQSNYTHQAEKEQLQTLLKEILFKREKEKFQKSCQGSKENTYRQEETMQRGKRGTVRRGETNWGNSDENQEVDYVEQIYDRKEKDTILKKESVTNSRKSVEPLGLRASNVQPKEQMAEMKGRKQADSKMKVQNLLSKLQIKIQKS